MIVHSLSRRQRVQCSQCGEFFFLHNTRSRIFLVLLIALMLLIAINLIVSFATK